MQLLSPRIPFDFFKGTFKFLLESLFSLTTPPTLTKTPHDLFKIQSNVIFKTGA